MSGARTPMVLRPAARAEVTARDAGLHHSSDARPGITRRRSGRGFAYRDRDGATIRHDKVLARIRSLAIPPAWTEVWICPSPRGHLQATGRDARRRQQLFQYIYDDGEVRDVASDDVNAYLRDASGGGFTAKDFRTWAGTLLAFRALRSLGPADGTTASRKNVLRAIREVADGLGNTP